MKPYAEACDQNRDPILAVIEPLFAACRHVLEIGSGTGQHAVYFARRMPHLIWHTSDLSEYHPGILQWIEEADLPNARPPLILDVTQSTWPKLSVDAVFSANTTHIMGWPAVQQMFRGIGELLPADGLLVLYGPFNYGGTYTSESNALFDQWLKARDPESGIRDFDALDRLAEAAGMGLEEDYPMPVNNRTLVWRKRS